MANRYRLCIFIAIALSITIQNGAAQQYQEQTLSTESVAARIGKSGWLLVDVRNSNAFNGWKVGDETRGGHIPGAINFALDWFKKSRARIAPLASAKKLSESRLILYGTSAEEARQMADWLHDHAEMPSDKLFIYADGFPAWSNDQLPVEKLARHEKLVPTWWVNNLLRSKESKDYRIVEVAWRQTDKYKIGHLPGAVYLDTDQIESAPMWNIVPAEKIKKTLLSLGITNDTLVVVYGRDQTAAARAATVMMYAGVSDVRLLNGGYQAWTDAGYEMDTSPVAPEIAEKFGVQIPARPEWIVGIEKADATLINPNGRLVSTRSWPEFIGETSGYTYIKPKGRIRGAVWGRFDIDAQGMDDFRNPDNTLRNGNEIEAKWQEQGISRTNDTCFYCGTGWRASEAFLAAYLMGFENISVFDGGWLEWSSNNRNPVDQGAPVRLETPSTR